MHIFEVLSVLPDTCDYTLPLSDIIIATVAMNNNCVLLAVDRHFAAITGLNLH
jgi:predicted nucleic acid-binding protein